LDRSKIRSLSVIAHIDHGKTTLSDRLLEVTGTVSARDMRAQYLDNMDIERERGITIKLQSVRLGWKDHVLNLIDTPGHVDFGYEVSRSLAACEGVILLVDAAQGIEAQTLANCYLALENDLEIVACLNKIDLPAAEPDLYAEEIENILGIPRDEVLRISAKTGEGIPDLLDAVIERIPAPEGDPDDPLQALIFDSHFDPYRGVVSSVRVMTGTLRSGDKLRFMQAGAVHEADEIGVRNPTNTPVEALGPGEAGYLIAGIKDVGEARSGETVTEVVARGMGKWDHYGVHTVAMALRLMGRGSAVRRVADSGSDAARWVTLDFGGERRAHLDVRAAENEWEVFSWTFAARTGNRYVAGKVADYDGFYHDQLKAVLDFFRTGEPPAPPEEALDTVAVIEGAERSRRADGAWISLDAA